MTSSILTVVTSYNSQAYIKATLESILDQNLNNIIHYIVLVDDASCDLTVNIAEKLLSDDQRHFIVARKTNAGYPSIPRNQGVQFALDNEIEFDYLCFCDADDRWLPDKLQNQLATFKQNSEASLVYTGQLLIEDELGEQRVVARRQISNLKDHFLFSHITFSSVMMKWESLERFKPLFNEDSELKAIEDFDLWTKLLVNGLRFQATQSTDIIYKLSEQSISRIDKKSLLERQRFLYKYLINTYQLNKLLIYPIMFIKLLKLRFAGAY